MKTKKSDSIQNKTNTENKDVRRLTDEEAEQVAGGAYIDEHCNPTDGIYSETYIYPGYPEEYYISSH